MNQLIDMKPQKVKHLHLEQEKKNPGYLGRTYAVMEKYDGWYGYMNCVAPHYPHMRSSTGRVIPAVQHIADAIADAGTLPAGRLVCEIMVRGCEHNFHALNGVLNRQKEKADAYILVHDFIPCADVHAPFKERFKFVEWVVSFVDNEDAHIAPVLQRSSKYEHWMSLARTLWSEGKEGVILKDWNAAYQPGKRNAALMKIKEEITRDLLVLGVEEGQGKYEGTLGTLKVRGRDGRVYSISGMTDSERAAWWAHPGDIIGKVVEVRAMKVLPQGTLREPRFKAVRHNKTREDID